MMEHWGSSRSVERTWSVDRKAKTSINHVADINDPPVTDLFRCESRVTTSRIEAENGLRADRSIMKNEL